MSFTRIFQTVLISTVVFLAGVLVGQNYRFENKDGKPQVNFVGLQAAPTGVDTKILWETYEKLNQNYVFRKDLDPKKLIYGAAEGMVKASGDPYTAFFDPENNEKFNKQLAGTYEGVGIQLGYKNNNLVVITPIIDTPAYKAGVQSGDLIIAIDERSAVDFSIPQAVSLIKGKEGTEVKLLVLRVQERKEFVLKRQKITIQSVQLSQKEGVVIIKLNQFGTDTKEEWDEAIDKVATGDLSQVPLNFSLGSDKTELNGETGKGKLKGVILDLRGNTGGLLEGAIDIAAEFISKSPIVLQEDASGNKVKHNIPSGKKGKLLDVPLVVLIDGGSASASEIVTGALMDYKRAKVVGEKSFGKGTVQSVVNLSDGSSLHVTTTKWLTPNGTWVHQQGIKPDQLGGIKPDIEVDRTDADFAAGKDPQIDAALKLFK